MGWLRAIRRGVFLERDGRPETGRVAWCWWPRSPLESLNGVLSVWAHINELARLRRLRRDDQKQLLHGLLHHCRVMSATRPAACRLGPLQVAMRALRSVTAEYVSERLIVGREPAALSTDAAGDEQEIGYIGLMSWK